MFQDFVRVNDATAIQFGFKKREKKKTTTTTTTTTTALQVKF